VCLARSVAVRGGAQRVCTCGAVPGRCAGQAQRPEPRVVVMQSRVFAQSTVLVLPVVRSVAA